MPEAFTRWLGGGNTKEAPRETERKVEGFKASGAVVVRDSRGTEKADFPYDKKGESMGTDPLAIYKPSGAKAIDPAKAMANFTGWVYAAVNAIASEASNVQLRLYKITDDDHEELDDHPLLTLLDGVNDHMTGIELKYMMFSHLELTGNFYMYLDGVNNDRDMPKALHLLNPGNVRVKLNKQSYPFTIDRYEYTLDGKIITFQPHQIVHGKYPDPNDPFVGIGFVQTIPTWIDTDNYAMEYNRKYFLNGGSFGMYVATQTNVEGQMERIKIGLRNEYAGVEQAHKIPVMPKGVDIKSAGMTQKDMDFANLSEVTRDRILAAARVSKTILGTAESDTNRATAETADYVFSKRTMKPKLLLVLAYLNEFLVPRYGDDLYLTFIDPVAEDKDARVREFTAASGGVPVMTQNEIRQNYLGQGPIDGGDKLLAPTTMQPVGISEKPEGEELAPQLAKGKKQPFAKVRTLSGDLASPMRIRAGGKSAFNSTNVFRSELMQAVKEALKESGLKIKSIGDLTKEEYREYWKRFDANAEKAEAELKDVFKGINTRQKSEVLANLSKTTGQKAVSDPFDPSQWIRLTIDLTTPILQSLTREEAAAAFSMIGTASTDILQNPGIQASLDTMVAKMAGSYNETVLVQIKTALSEEMAKPEGTSLANLETAVKDVYDFADEVSAARIARTESARAANFANREAWKQSGVVETIKWYTVEDEKVCPQCEELDGKEVSLASDEPFFVDETGYSDGTIPPAHPNCRCYIRPGKLASL